VSAQDTQRHIPLASRSAPSVPPTAARVSERVSRNGQPLTCTALRAATRAEPAAATTIEAQARPLDIRALAGARSHGFFRRSNRIQQRGSSESIDPRRTFTNNDVMRGGRRRTKRRHSGLVGRDNPRAQRFGRQGQSAGMDPVRRDRAALRRMFTARSRSVKAPSG
jgi:hypothetical protein